MPEPTEGAPKTLEEVLKAAGGDKDKLKASLQKADLPADVLAAVKEIAEYAGIFSDDDPEDGAEKSAVKKGASAEELLKAEVAKLPEPIRKAYEAQEERIAKAEKDAAEAQEVAKAEALKVRKSEFLTKAEGLPHVPGRGTAEEFAEVLRDIADKAPESFKKMEEILKSADEAIRTSEIFKSRGSSRTGSPGALGELQQKAEDIRKAETDLTQEQAFSKAAEANPELYSRYQAEAV